MKTKILILTLALVLSLVVTGLASNGVELPRWVQGGGAPEASAGVITLRATLGQPVVGSVSGGGATLGQGFWHGGITERCFAIYLPTIQM